MLSSISTTALLLAAAASVSAQTVPEGVFTIQTHIPTPGTQLSVPSPGETPISMDPVLSDPIPSSLTVTDDGLMSIPAGETPITTGLLSSVPPFTSPVTLSTSAGSPTSDASQPPSSASTTPAEQTGVAAPGPAGEGGAFAAAAAAGLSVLFGVAWTVL